MTRPVLFLGVLAICMAACSTTGAQVQHGINAYQRGDYSGAAEQLASLESETSDMNPKGHCRYLIYSGLSHYRLGHRETARRFLLDGIRAMERGDSRWIAPNIAEEARRALADVADSPGRGRGAGR